MHSLAWLLFAVIFGVIARIRLSVIAPRESVPRRRGLKETCHLGVFLGSGGHSSEALSLVSALDFARYTPRTYLVSQGDTLSEQKAVALERLKAASASSLHPEIQIGGYQILTVPRARRVHQNTLTIPFTALQSLLAALYHVTLAPRFPGHSASFDVLLLNGPGTCFVLCVAVYVNRFLGLPSPRVVYVETFARVRMLSSTGKLLRRMVDRFIVQWPDLLQDGGRGECHGWLV